MVERIKALTITTATICCCCFGTSLNSIVGHTVLHTLSHSFTHTSTFSHSNAICAAENCMYAEGIILGLLARGHGRKKTTKNELKLARRNLRNQLKCTWVVWAVLCRYTRSFFLSLSRSHSMTIHTQPDCLVKFNCSTENVFFFVFTAVETVYWEKKLLFIVYNFYLWRYSLLAK